MGIVNKLKHVIPLSAELHIYNSITLSDLNFCILAWDDKFDRIVKFPENISSILSLSKYNSHIEPICKDLGY